METTYFYLTFIGLIIAACILDPNVPQLLSLQVTRATQEVHRISFLANLGARLWFDRLGHRRGPLGRMVSGYQLRRIRNNPAYTEFFQDRKE